MVLKKSFESKSVSLNRSESPIMMSLSSSDSNDSYFLRNKVETQRNNNDSKLNNSNFSLHSTLAKEENSPNDSNTFVSLSSSSSDSDVSSIKFELEKKSTEMVNKNGNLAATSNLATQKRKNNNLFLKENKRQELLHNSKFPAGKTENNILLPNSVMDTSSKEVKKERKRLQPFSSNDKMGFSTLRPVSRTQSGSSVVGNKSFPLPPLSPKLGPHSENKVMTVINGVEVEDVDLSEIPKSGNELSSNSQGYQLTHVGSPSMASKLNRSVLQNRSEADSNSDIKLYTLNRHPNESNTGHNSSFKGSENLLNEKNKKHVKHIQFPNVDNSDVNSNDVPKQLSVYNIKKAINNENVAISNAFDQVSLKGEDAETLRNELIILSERYHNVVHCYNVTKGHVTAVSDINRRLEQEIVRLQGILTAVQDSEPSLYQLKQQIEAIKLSFLQFKTELNPTRSKTDVPIVTKCLSSSLSEIEKIVTAFGNYFSKAFNQQRLNNLGLQEQVHYLLSNYRDIASGNKSLCSFAELEAGMPKINKSIDTSSSVISEIVENLKNSLSNYANHSEKSLDNLVVNKSLNQNRIGEQNHFALDRIKELEGQLRCKEEQILMLKNSISERDSMLSLHMQRVRKRYEEKLKTNEIYIKLLHEAFQSLKQIDQPIFDRSQFSVIPGREMKLAEGIKSLKNGSTQALLDSNKTLLKNINLSRESSDENIYKSVSRIATSLDAVDKFFGHNKSNFNLINKLKDDACQLIEGENISGRHSELSAQKTMHGKNFEHFLNINEIANPALSKKTLFPINENSNPYNANIFVSKDKQTGIPKFLLQDQPAFCDDDGKLVHREETNSVGDLYAERTGCVKPNTLIKLKTLLNVGTEVKNSTNVFSANHISKSLSPLDINLAGFSKNNSNSNGISKEAQSEWAKKLLMKHKSNTCNVKIPGNSSSVRNQMSDGCKLVLSIENLKKE